MISSSQKREIEAEIKRFGEEVSRIGEGVTSSLKRILPSSASAMFSDNNNSNENECNKFSPRHSLPAMRHSPLNLKRLSLNDSSNLGPEGADLDSTDHLFFTLPLQRLMSIRVSS